MLRISVWSIAVWGCWATVAQAQLFEDDLPAAGLIARYDDRHGNDCERVDQDIGFVWGAAPPDPRLGKGEFTVTWRGRVLLRSSGEYRLRAFACGKVRVAIDGVDVLEGRASQPQWIDGTATQQRAGFRDLEVEFFKTEPTARLTLYWSGPNFGLEPIGADLLFHDASRSDASGFQRGRQLVRALRCTACHTIPTAAPALRAPELDDLAGNLNGEWIADWLSRADSSDKMSPEQRRMPHFKLTAAEGRAIAAYLTLDDRSSRAVEDAARTAPRRGKAAAGDAEKGETLFVSLGCLACHTWQDQGTSSLFGGSDLSEVGAKRPTDFFRRWLADPAEINRDHRMPVFELSDREQADLAAFLSRQSGSRQTSAPASHPDEILQSTIALGQRLITDYRCSACHAMDATPADTQEQASLALTRSTDWNHSCVAAGAQEETPANRGQPHYILSLEDRRAIEHYVHRVTEVEEPHAAVADGAALLEQSNCLACHPRGLGKGITDAALPIADRYSDSVEHVAALVPPSLNSIGDKLHEKAMRDAIRRAGAPRRPWLKVRMPRYPFSDEQVQQLVDHFIAKDRIPEVEVEPVARLSEAALATVGARLVTSDGFGCVSCHALGGVEPAAAPINARGPDLTAAGDRIRRTWFTRWVADPLRIVPRVEMPALSIPAPGVLDGDLARQIDAVWQVLNLDGFRPPKPDPFRIVRRRGVPSAEESAAVLTDVLRMGEHQWIKPLLIGLPNRHNVLFDLQDARVDGWWIGNVAQQHVAGKTWYWEAAGANLLDAEPGEPEIVLVDAGSAPSEPLLPQYVGQFRTELDQWQHTGGGLAVDHRLHFDRTADSSGSAERFTVGFHQTFEPLFASWDSQNAGDRPRSGWLRTIRLTGVPPGVQVRLHPLPTSAERSALRVTQDGQRLELIGDASVQIELVGVGGVAFDSQGGLTLPAPEGTVELTLRYTTALAVDRFPALPEQPSGQSQPQRLSIAPGFTATKLPLPTQMLPTGFAWEADGALVTTSLEGRVWRAVDRDGDGLHDAAMAISDVLATPFGLAAEKGYLDVINKYGLLRLWDDDGDGRAERTQTVASGWGHTDDYHDWAVGLPRTKRGGYWMTLSCQQDERSDAAAYLRGTVVQLVPRQPTQDNPHCFTIEPFTGGHRFPIGIAVNGAGEAFVPDNQGNYNPFNELNHLQKGKRYGFINANEKRPGFAPQLTPPAIDIPHPWTRSVNGICFLSTPTSVAQSSFGPFEGHLVGCEYDTQRLIRMSLERVGDTYQGAAYPLTYQEPVQGPPLLGPISCAVSPAGDLYIGNIRESGWGGGQNVGDVVKMEMMPETLPAGIAEVTALPQGFRIAFTSPVSPEAAENPANYNIASYTRVSTPQYGGEDQQRRDERIVDLRYDEAEHAVMIHLEPLREGFVYEFFLDNLTGDPDAEFFPAEAYYTLRNVPHAKP